MATRGGLYNVMCRATDNMQFFYNGSAWTDAMIVMGRSLVARTLRPTSVATRRSFILNFSDCANKWAFANLHLPTSWQSTAEYKDEV